jgi:hypothetical protein
VSTTRDLSRSTRAGFETESLDVTSERVETISRSSLGTYVNSPREYFFDRLLDTPAKEYFEEGTLFHDFAEFYVNHPELITDDTLEECAEVMCGEVEPFFRDTDREVRQTKYRIGLRTIVETLDPERIGGQSFLTADNGWGENVFAEYYDRPVDSPYAERWFENRELGLEGKIDLVQGPAHLLDHKSGAKTSRTSVVTDSALDPPSDTPNFQALLYLTHYRTERPGEELRFTFFHFLETLDEVVTGEADLEDCLTTIPYHPVTYEEYVARPSTFGALQEDAPKACRKTFSQVDYEVYEAPLSAQELPDTREKDEFLTSEFGQALIDRVEAAAGPHKYVRKGSEQALKYLLRVRNEHYFVGDLDAFEAFVEERLDELNDRRAGDERFPVAGPGGEPNYRYLNHRDCILRGETR